ncbi:MAG: DUF4301 family protein [Bacteroidales bacterium]|nr:DUF4301 family protein [Bacteroidales bacterium]
MSTNFTPEDLNQLAERGIAVEKVEAQLERFRQGFPYLKIESPSAMGQGITPVDADVAAACEARWQQFLADGGDVLKFVPASGAASRMFKALFAFVNGTEEIPAQGSPVADLCARIKDFAFYDKLQATLARLYGQGTTAESLIADGRYKDLVGAIILPDGMNYGGLPKALLTFHKYADGSVRTALEEQLAEGAQTAASKGGVVKLHFTVSADHRKLFEEKIAEAVPAMEKKFGVKYEISLSEQKPSTDTIAVTPDNELFRTKEGRLVFRPGGHGALIENLNDIDSAVVFIKNIDNVVGDAHRADTVTYKRLIGGMLLLAHDRILALTQALLAEDCTEETVAAATEFVEKMLCTSSEALDPEKPLAERRAALLAIFDRPLRVCGMVRNEGEPGGGPYNAWASDGSYVAPQILESTQIDLSKPENKEMMQKATHFNPVDLVCYLRRPDGSAYHLPDYVDHNTGFISEKSFDGRDLRALELPGLWNGAMSKWNTIFVEVPASTFNPVKTVNDLLRPAHQ